MAEFYRKKKKICQMCAGKSVDYKDADIIKNGLSEISEKSYESGHEKINGKNYYYEEYDDIGAFFIMTKYDEQNEIKTRFYFDNNGNLTYIKTIYGEESELLKVNLENSVDDSLFEIPANYAEN